MKVQPRTKLEQKMMPIKSEQLRTIKKKYDPEQFFQKFDELTDNEFDTNGMADKVIKKSV